MVNMMEGMEKQHKILSAPNIDLAGPDTRRQAETTIRPSIGASVQEAWTAPRKKA